MSDKKDWEEFRKIGLLLYINQILQAFGWSIVYEIDENEIIKNVYPARVKYRGFDNKHVCEAYKNISYYLKENIDKIAKESED